MGSMLPIKASAALPSTSASTRTLKARAVAPERPPGSVEAWMSAFSRSSSAMRQAMGRWTVVVP